MIRSSVYQRQFDQLVVVALDRGAETSYTNILYINCRVTLLSLTRHRSDSIAETLGICTRQDLTDQTHDVCPTAQRRSCQRTDQTFDMKLMTVYINMDDRLYFSCLKLKYRRYDCCHIVLRRHLEPDSGAGASESKLLPNFIASNI